jgi:hypothetical protein
VWQGSAAPMLREWQQRNEGALWSSAAKYLIIHTILFGASFAHFREKYSSLV